MARLQKSQGIKRQELWQGTVLWNIVNCRVAIKRGETFCFDGVCNESEMLRLHVFDLFICLAVGLSVSVGPSVITLIVCLSVCLSCDSSICQSLHISTYQSVCPSKCWLLTSHFSEQGTPDESTEKPRRRKKPKTPEPGIDGETARENLGYDNDGALDGEDVSGHLVILILCYEQVHVQIL